MRNPFSRKPEPAAQLSQTIREANAYQTTNYRLKRENAVLSNALAEKQNREAAELDSARRFLSEMLEAQCMCGPGPWQAGDVQAIAHASKPLREALNLQEAGPVSDVAPLGAQGMYELLLQNVNWQREINYSWLEFTRWGIQQIILICRLYYLKNPIPRRLIDVRAEYTFARGYDVTTNDENANEEIKDFIRRNQKVLGHVAMTAQQRAKDHDGNMFWVFFTDPGTGKVTLRTIDATEIQDIWTDPEDSDTPQYYKREWTERANQPDGTRRTISRKAWYPAIDFEPTEKLMTIAGDPVMWDTPVYHRKIGTVGKWLFGCPRMYPMVDWAKEARRFLEACASVRQSLSQFAFNITTKGGQQAIEGIKQQMETTVGPGQQAWDSNPPAVAGSSWISGPGTKLDAFKVQGATFSPEDVRQYKLMCCMVLGMPETFLGDVSTGNLATATSLDRPTETVFLSIQEEWIEDLTIIFGFMLKRSLRAPGGKLRESCAEPSAITIRAAERKLCTAPGGVRYWGFAEAKQSDTEIDIQVMFPAIREGDMAVLVKACVEAMTLDNKGGQVVGIDEKTGVLWLMKQLGVEQAEEIVDKMYPEKGPDAYDPLRANDVLPPPIPKLQDQPGVEPTPAQVGDVQAAVKESFARLANAIGEHLE
jgi:hypothetical protein